MSHSLNVVRIAAVCCAITSCCAILRRNGDIFFRVKRAWSPVGDEGWVPAKLTAFATDSALPLRSVAANTSPFVRRPPSPVPRIFSGSSFSSSTMRRTAGESTAGGVGDSGPPRSAPAATEAVFFSNSASVFLFSSDCFFGFSSFLSAVRCFESSITATTSPIFTSCPSGTFVSSTPDFSATISVETLSVSSANSGSPSFTNSPDFLCQAETTPLVTDSPTDGTFTSVIIVRVT